MTGHLTDAELERFVTGAQMPEALLDADDHLAACTSCRTRAAALRDAASAARAIAGAAAPAGLHATDEEIQAHVAGTLDAATRARLDAHAEDCPTCARQIAELRAWATPPRSSASVMRWYALAAAAVLAISIPVGYWQAMQRAEPAGLRGLATLAPDVQARVRQAIQTGRITLPPQIVALAGPPETLMGTATPPPFHLLTPVAIAVIQDRPVLAWEPFPGADRYVVTIADDQGQPVVRGLEARGPAVTLPDPLPRGRVYTWQVTAHHGPDAVSVPAPPQPPARFEVLDQSQADALLVLERAQPDAHVLLGMLYLQAGVVEDARRHFRAVPADDPQRPLVDRTLRQIAPAVSRSAEP